MIKTIQLKPRSPFQEIDPGGKKIYYEVEHFPNFRCNRPSVEFISVYG